MKAAAAAYMLVWMTGQHLSAHIDRDCTDAVYFRKTTAGECETKRDKLNRRFLKYRDTLFYAHAACLKVPQ